MNLIDRFSVSRCPALYALFIGALASCTHHHRPFTEQDHGLVKDSVIRLAEAIARDVSSKGPIAWLDYFDDSPGFLMANDGNLAFRDYQTAKKFIQDTLVIRVGVS
ncbi:MAG: hypothetical protein Q8927_21540 [Bacteroidota bacterium]|nr:hypothetical protein [Bacteroidota bacterium]